MSANVGQQTLKPHCMLYIFGDGTTSKISPSEVVAVIWHWSCRISCAFSLSKFTFCYVYLFPFLFTINLVKGLCLIKYSDIYCMNCYLMGQMGRINKYLQEVSSPVAFLHCLASPAVHFRQVRILPPNSKGMSCVVLLKLHSVPRETCFQNGRHATWGQK